VTGMSLDFVKSRKIQFKVNKQFTRAQWNIVMCAAANNDRAVKDGHGRIATIFFQLWASFMCRRGFKLNRN
jgi:hypothetical protein